MGLTGFDAQHSAQRRRTRPRLQQWQKQNVKFFSEVKRVFEWFVGLFTASYTVTAPVLA
jgi:hypothetical protein